MSKPNITIAREYTNTFHVVYFWQCYFKKVVCVVQYPFIIVNNNTWKLWCLQFAQEAPNSVTRKKSQEGWWSWWGGGTGDTDTTSDTEEGEVFIHRPSNLPEWLDGLTPDEQEKLFKSIGYDENQNMEHQPQVSGDTWNTSLMF